MAPPTWAEISFRVPPDQTELASFLAREATGAGVQIDEAVEILGPELGYRVLADQPVTLRLYLPVLDNLGAQLATLREALDGLDPSPEIATRQIAEADWAEAWKEHYDVQRVGRRLVIKPTWKPFAADPGDTVVELNPGQAFGTGQHETTRLSLALLEEAVSEGDSVLDAGCGSGILAIAAARLGARKVLAVDIDPVAVRVALENVALNDLQDAVICQAGTVDGSFASAHGREFHVAAANIIADVVIAMAPALAAVIVPGGRLVASGIILEREGDARRALEAAGFRHERAAREGNWCAMLFSAP